MNRRAKISMDSSIDVKKQQALGFEQTTPKSEPAPAPPKTPAKARVPKKPVARAPAKASTSEKTAAQASKASASTARQANITAPPASAARMQSLAMEKFFFFVLGLRKDDIRKRVESIRTRYPGHSPEELARRLISAQAPLSLIGSALMHVPMLIPAFGPALKILGMTGGAVVMAQLNMSLVLEIALLFGHDIDERARVKELGAVMALTGLSSGTAMIPDILTMKPHLRFILGGLTVVTVSQLIGEAAIRYYGGQGSRVQDPAT